MPGQVKWFGDRVLREVQAGRKRNMMAACVHLRREIVRSIGEPGPTKTHRENAPSQPGEPPHKRTGRLRQSIASEVAANGQTGKVGSYGSKGVEYAAYLELGTGVMGARPFLRPALDREADKLAKILGRPIGGSVST